MLKNAVFPKGNWYYPECALVDPAKYGPLQAGRKSKLEWFKVGPDGQTQRVSLERNNPAQNGENELKESKECWDLSEYLVVHGFVFRRCNEQYSNGAEGEGSIVPTCLN
jgi:hypothetical protein